MWYEAILNKCAKSLSNEKYRCLKWKSKKKEYKDTKVNTKSNQYRVDQMTYWEWDLHEVGEVGVAIFIIGYVVALTF